MMGNKINMENVVQRKREGDRSNEWRKRERGRSCNKKGFILEYFLDLYISFGN